MAIDPTTTDTVTIPQLDPLTLALESFLVGANADGKMGNFTAEQLINFIAPYISALGASPYIETTGTVLSNPTEKSTALTFVAAGTFTQTTGGDIVTTDPLNLLSWNGATWSITIEIPITLTDYVLKDDIVNDVTTGGIDVPLSAEQGVVLSERTDELVELLGVPVIVNRPLDFSTLTNVGGAGSVFFNYIPQTVDSILYSFRSKTVIGASITPVCYTITGTNGALVYTLLHTYTSYPATAIEMEVLYDDSFVIPAGSYIGFATTGNAYSGTLTGTHYCRTILPSLVLNTAIAYDFKINTTLDSGLLEQVDAIETDLAAAPYQPIASKNIFNVNDILLDSITNTTGVITTNTGFFVTGYMAVEGGNTYSISRTTARQYFFSNGDDPLAPGYTVYTGSDLNGLSSFSVPAAAKFMRVTIPKTRSYNFQIEKGAVITGWTPFGETTSLKEQARNSNYLANQIFVSYGDSIVDQERWQYKMMTRLAMVHRNFGIGGTTMSGNGTNQGANPTRLATLPEAYLYIINFGMNDWRNNISIGAITDIVAGTLYGGMYVIMDNLLTRFPNARLIFNTVSFGMLSSSTTLNAGGKTTGDYSDAIIAFGKKYNIPVADTSGTTGWNQLNIATFVDLELDGSYIHPNDLGGQRMADIIYNTVIKTSH